MKTETLIRTLAAEASPVRPLSPPARRCADWFALALPTVALGVRTIGVRADLAGALARPDFRAELALLFGLALTSATAALILAVPDRRKPSALLLPGVALAGCLVLFGGPSLTGDFGPAGFKCLRNVLVLSLPPAVALGWMVRKAFPLRGEGAGALAALGAFALGCLGTRLICPHDHPGHFPVWHFFPVALATLAGFYLGKFLRR